MPLASNVRADHENQEPLMTETRMTKTKVRVLDSNTRETGEVCEPLLIATVAVVALAAGLVLGATISCYLHDHNPPSATTSPETLGYVFAFPDPPPPPGCSGKNCI